MNNRSVSLIILLTVIALLVMPTAGADARKQKPLPEGTAVIWQRPGDIVSRDLFYGQGGKQGMPSGSFKFIKKSQGGSQPKFIVEDRQGRRWKVKIGVEAQPETAVTRLLWAVGYFTDETYYLPIINVEAQPKDWLDADAHRFLGLVWGARLERERDKKNMGSWSWFDNPFQGTRELDGLKVLMALVNNWDLKQDNNAIAVDKRSGELRYFVHDLGATLGRTGGKFDRTKNNIDDFERSQFIDRIGTDLVDFHMGSRPPWWFWFHLPYWQERTRISTITRNIPREHARWMGQLLSQLSDHQLMDALRAANYSPDEASRITAVLRARIDLLLTL